MKVYPRCAICRKIIREAMYMVKGEVWAEEASLFPKEHACMKCLIKAIDRPIIYQDFSYVVLNDVWTAGMKLPCCFCLFEELKARYRIGMDTDATYMKLKIINNVGQTSPKNYMIVDKCTCNSIE